MEADYFTPTIGRTWPSGTFGCVRSEGWQIHEGIDIKCTQRDTKGEPIDPVSAAADGTIAHINAKPGLKNYGNYIVMQHPPTASHFHLPLISLIAVLRPAIKEIKGK
jgi:murein DD-endopeptidase MepM/ murein hydrolase activator NlpD